MITAEHVEYYKTFGFVILRRQLHEQMLERLSAEISSAFRDAFGARFDERPDCGGISGHYLPVMSASLTPTSLEIVEQLHPVARRFLDGEALPAPAEAILLFGEAPWHDDTGFAVASVKFAAYLEPLTAGNGALRLLPGSHLQPYRNAARGFDRSVSPQRREEIRAAVERLPGHACETDPGDVIAFDQRLYHASINGCDRRQWTVSFYRDPASFEEAGEVGAALTDEVVSDYGSWGEYDPRRYPFYDPEWIANVEQTWRAPAIRRLRELGVLEAAARSAAVVPVD
jgi:hypothetical protein